MAAKARDRLFKVVLSVPNPEGRIRSGMVARVGLEPPPEILDQAVLVPLSALVARSGATTRPPRLSVFVVVSEGASQRAHERPIETEDIVRSSILVTSGLTTNDWVVVNGASTLSEGAPVTVAPELP